METTISKYEEEIIKNCFFYFKRDLSVKKEAVEVRDIVSEQASFLMDITEMESRYNVNPEGLALMLEAALNADPKNSKKYFAVFREVNYILNTLSHYDWVIRELYKEKGELCIALERRIN